MDVHTRPRNLVCIDPSARIGGATRVLLTALGSLDAASCRAAVVCNPGPVAAEYAAAGHEVVPLDLPPLTFTGGLRALRDTVVRFGRSSAAIARVCADRSAAGIWANGLAAVLYGSHAALGGRVRLVWHVHEMYDLRARMRPFVVAASAASRGIVCVSRAACERVVRLGGRRSKCHVVYNALPAALAGSGQADLGDPPIAADAPVLVAVGALTPAKGHATLVEAMPEILRTHPRATALVVGEPLHAGDEAFAAGLRRRVERLGLGEHVRFLGFRRDVERLVAGAAVVVHPSLCEETFGLVPLEAMALGRPVVASRVGGVPEVIDDGKTGLLVEPGDAHGLASAVSALLGDPALRARIAAEATRSVSERFTLGRMLAGLNEAASRSLGFAPFAAPAQERR